MSNKVQKDIQNAVQQHLLQYKFEVNDESTRRHVCVSVEMLLLMWLDRGDLTMTSVQCDDVNNIPDDIDNAILNVDVTISQDFGVMNAFRFVLDSNGCSVVQRDDNVSNYDRAMRIMGI